MKTLAIVVVALTMSVSVGSAQVPAIVPDMGQGSLRMGWDNCDPILQQELWTGPGAYKLVGAISNSSLAAQGHEVIVSIQPAAGFGYPDSWRFDAGGCQEGVGVSVALTHGGLSKACPAFQGTNALNLNQFSYNAATGVGTIRIVSAYGTFTPDPIKRYVLWQAAFDHSASTPGPSIPGLSCGSVETPLEFSVTRAVLLTTDGFEVPMAMEVGLARWQTAPPGAPGTVSTPALPGTWGYVKALYR